eukprot:250678-Chlamydomonas_euryale.AAC.1
MSPLPASLEGTACTHTFTLRAPTHTLRTTTFHYKRAISTHGQSGVPRHRLRLTLPQPPFYTPTIATCTTASYRKRATAARSVDE